MLREPPELQSFWGSVEGYSGFIGCFFLVVVGNKRAVLLGRFGDSLETVTKSMEARQFCKAKQV